jgi:hypothetical protein
VTLPFAYEATVSPDGVADPLKTEMSEALARTTSATAGDADGDEELARRAVAELRATGALRDGTFRCLMRDMERLDDTQLSLVLGALAEYGRTTDDRRRSTVAALLREQGRLRSKWSASATHDSTYQLR